MIKIITLIISDLKNILRDKTLLTFLTTPVTMVLFVRYFVPYIGAKYPVMEAYYPYIVMFGSVQAAIMFGFITAFMILEEKDENVLQVIRILPITPSFFLLYRLSFATFLSCVGAFAMIQSNGLISLPLGSALFLSFQLGMTAPFITLVVATFAKNKIEGMAFFKGVDLLLLLPMLSFLIPNALKYFFGVIPVFWAYQLFDNVLKGEDLTFTFLAGIAVYFMVFGKLFMEFRRRVFDR
ncbi:MAG: hypothetical protein MUE81_02510 [Thermoflexibacter sp.]|jgi:hypothetical protein|nr:hypothetical protein [Thermoflexibacter sp.]